MKRTLEHESNADGISVEAEFLHKLLAESFGIELSAEEEGTLSKAFSAKSETPGTKKVNMKPFFDFEDSQKLKKTYKTFKYRLDEFQDMNTVDTAGYFGTNHRLVEMLSWKFVVLDDFDVILDLFLEKNLLVKVMQTIRTIDREKNGFVTNQELEDILKLFYKEQLSKYDLKPALKQFASDNNRLLINYHKFRDHVTQHLNTQASSFCAAKKSPLDKVRPAGCLAVKHRKSTALEALRGNRGHELDPAERVGGRRIGEYDPVMSLIGSLEFSTSSLSPPRLADASPDVMPAKKPAGGRSRPAARHVELTRSFGRRSPTASSCERSRGSAKSAAS